MGFAVGNPVSLCSELCSSVVALADVRYCLMVVQLAPVALPRDLGKLAQGFVLAAAFPAIPDFSCATYMDLCLEEKRERWVGCGTRCMA